MKLAKIKTKDGIFPIAVLRQMLNFKKEFQLFREVLELEMVRWD
jgi:hypothetical protein